MSEKKGLFLGIDTSNYTTSIALSTYEGEIVANIKRLLDVKEGERGLRQSDAVFSHTKNLPQLSEILSDALADHVDKKILAVGYSAYPRDNEGSYMPCFLVGRSAASMVSAVCGCPSYAFSHQSGHIRAAVYGACAEWLCDKGGFIAFHVSGGTTEVLLVSCKNGRYSIERIGGTLDINAGQAIDRTGVLMGLKFPCGAEMDRLSSACSIKKQKTRISVKGTECSLSGLENLAKKVFCENGDMALTSAYVFDFVAETLSAMSKAARERYGELPILYAGGVMSNSRIKRELSALSETYFAAPEYSSDNAVGVALLAREKFISEGN